VHGHTADVGRPLTYEQMAEDTAALLHALGIQSADFVGYSMGGAVALQVAMWHPRLVRRLVYAGGACFDSAGLYPEALDAMTKTPAGHLDGSVWHQAYVNVAPHPGAWPALVAKVNELDRTFAGWPAEEVQRVRAPTMLIIGDSDMVHPEHTVQMFRLLGGGVPGDLAGLPTSQLAVLPGTSHVGLLDRSEWLSPMIATFLDPTAPGRTEAQQ
jgi:pimeloyl-ACP methyl ester carboxylesterase